MNYIKITFWSALAICVLYWMKVTIVVDFIDSFKGTWNYTIDYVTTLRYKQPLFFLCLPGIALWCLGRK